ncbi:MAG: hypothetical protein ACP5M7_08695 [Thermoproteota archaeon]
MDKKRIILFLVVLVGIALYISSVISNQEIKTELLIDEFFELSIKFPNGSEVFYSLGYMGSSSKSLILPKEFNITRVFMYTFLRPKEDSLPITFIYIPRVFPVLHVAFPNGSEVVFGNFIVDPWSSGSVYSSVCLGGYKEGRTYVPDYGKGEVSEYFELSSLNPIKTNTPFLLPENLTDLVRSLISKYKSFSILFYAPSSFTVLNKTQFQIVHDMCISRLDFKSVNNSVILNITSAKPKSLGTYKLVYDQKSLEHRSIIYSLQLSFGEIAFIILVSLAIFYSYKKFKLTKTLLLLGIVLFVLGHFQFFDFAITYVNGAKINIFFYSYLTDGNLSYPLEVVWHISKAISNGTKVIWNFEPNKIGYAFLIGYNNLNLPGSLCHRTNPKPTDSIFNGLADTYLYVNLSDENSTLFFNSSHRSWIMQPASSVFYTQNLTMPFRALGRNRKLTFSAGVQILAVWSGQNIKGGFIEDNLKLCEIKVRTEGNQTLLESFYLPAAYIQPSADVVEEAKEFEQITNLLLELTGLIFMLASVIELSKQEHLFSKGLSKAKKTLAKVYVRLALLS